MSFDYKVSFPFGVINRLIVDGATWEDGSRFEETELTLEIDSHIYNGKNIEKESITTIIQDNEIPKFINFLKRLLFVLDPPGFNNQPRHEQTERERA